MKKSKTPWNKQSVISEYLSSEESFESLSEKYNIPARTIQSWVRIWRKTNPEPEPSQEAMSEREKELEKQVAHLQLKNELLEEMLKLSEQHTGIALRKKFGTRQS